MKKSIVTFISAIVLILALAGVSHLRAAAPAPKGDPIKVGAIFASTGNSSSLGLPEKQTAEMLVEQINAGGGILGRPLQLVIYDDEGDETKTLMLAKRLIFEDKVVAIIGPTTSGTSMAIIDTLTNAKIPLISCAASYKIVQDEKGAARPWIFKTPQSDSMAVSRIYEYLNKQKIADVAIMTVSNGYGDSGRAELLRLAATFKIKVVAEEKFGQDDVDTKAQLTRIKATTAKAIIVWGTQKAPAIVSKDAKTLGMTQLIVQSHGVASKKFLELCGDACNGEVLPAGRLIIANQLPAGDQMKALLLKYVADYEGKYKSPVSTFGGHAYDAITLLKAAIEKAKSTDSEKVRVALEQLKGVKGTAGIFNMSPTDHNGLTKDSFVMIRIEKNDWVLIK